MSTKLSEEGSAAASTELERLSGSVRRLLSEWDRWHKRAASAEARVRELESALREVTSGKVDPVALGERVQALEQENRFLARRLDRARESVKRISARLQFLDEDR